MALVGNVLLGTGAAPGMSSIASAYAESAASSRIPWSALEYSGQTITAISGSAIGGQGGGGDTSQCMPISGMTAYQTVSSISSWTADLSSISSKQDALTFGYSGEYISSINGSAIIDTQGGGGGDTSECLPKSASADFYPMSGNPSGFLTAHQDISNKLDSSAFTSYTSTALSGIQDNITALSSVVSSGPFQPTGDYAYESSLSSKLDASASGGFAPSGDYALNSSLSGKLDNSASSTWYPTGNPSGFLTAHQSLSGYTPESAISSQSAVWNTVTGKVDQSAISSWSSDFVYKSAVSGCSAQIETLSSVLSSLSATVSEMTANKYTLSAGNGISITNDTANKRTIIATV